MPFVGIFIPNQYLASTVIWGVMIIAAAIYYFALRRGVFTKVDRMFEEVEA